MQTNHLSQTLALTPLSFLHLCAKYLRTQFQNKLNAHLFSASATALTQPLMLLVALALELDIIAITLVSAFFNQSQYNKNIHLCPLIIYCQRRWSGILPVMQRGCRKILQNQEMKGSNEKEVALRK